jgi:hypothetical protein
MHILALLTAVGAKAIEALNKPKETTPPVFKKLPGFTDDRLDARPVIWSLQHRPEEWSWVRQDPHPMGKARGYLRHNPSEHIFVAVGESSQLYSADNCSCHHTSRAFQDGQAVAFDAAVQAWEAERGRQQFAGHFTNA